MGRFETSPSALSSPEGRLDILTHIDAGINELTKYNDEPTGFRVDRARLYGVLGNLGLVLPKIITNNPNYHDLVLVLMGQRDGQNPLNPKAISLTSSGPDNELNPWFVYKITFGEVPMAHEGFQDIDDDGISENGLIFRRATIQDLMVADVLTNRSLEFRDFGRYNFLTRD